MDLLKVYKKRSGVVSRQGKEKARRTPSPHSACYPLTTDRGVALVMALLISLAVSLLIVSTIYFIIQSTNISGAGKRYATASEAADGAVEIAKDAISLILMGEPASSLPVVDPDPPCLVNSVLNENESCTAALKLPAKGLLSSYSARITITRLYASSVGSRIEFARSGSGDAVYFRINTVVMGPAGTRAETTALYRHIR
jgi:Tfp pilus assembly protein PilX